MYIAHLVSLLDLCVISNTYMNINWEKCVLFKDAINAKIIYNKRWLSSNDKMKPAGVQAKCSEQHLS
jgi:hypothetical protein